MPLVEDFLRGLDRAFTGALAERLVLQVIGSTALMLQVDYERGTTDSDVLETAQIDATIRRRLLDVAGPRTDLHIRHTSTSTSSPTACRSFRTRRAGIRWSS